MSPSTTALAPITGKPVSITIAASGDLIPHPGVLRAGQGFARGGGFDFTPMFAQVKPVLAKADLAICQMETPLTDVASQVRFESANGAPIFTAPAQFALAAKQAGFDGCSTGNNHAYDNGMVGLSDTPRILKSIGLQNAGPAPQAADRVAWYDVRGVKIAQLSYSWTLSNTIGDETYAPPSAPWLKQNLYEVVQVEGILREAAAARQAGADFVIASMHWGIEQVPKLSPEESSFGPALLKSGLIDYVIGNHPHVVQQCDKIDGRYIVYSNGNMLSQQGPPYFKPIANDGVITTVTLTRDAAGSVSQKLTFQPTWVDRSDSYRIKLATPATNAASYQRTVAAITLGNGGATPAS